MFKRISITLAVVMFAAGVIPLAEAGPADSKNVVPAPAPDDDIFQTGHFEFQALAGPFFSQQPTHDARPNFDYVLTALRVGVMADTPRGHGFFRGNDEFLFEGQGSVLFQGPGTAMGGASFLYRRNFVQPSARVIPYFTAGLGGLYDDIYHNRTQRAIGGRFQFNLEAEVGLRILVGHRGTSAIDLEAAYRHISDASITERNDGIDSVGGEIGYSFFF